MNEWIDSLDLSPAAVAAYMVPARKAFDFARVTPNPARDRPPSSFIGVWSDGRRRPFRSLEISARRYFIEDANGRVRRGVVPTP